MFGLQAADREVPGTPGHESDRLVLSVGRCRDQIVSGRQAQPVPGVEHREVLEMRVRVAEEETCEDAAIQAVRLRRQAAGRLVDEAAHILVASFVLVVTGTPAQELVELLEMKLASSGCPVKPPHDERRFVDTRDFADFEVDDLIAGQESGSCERGQQLELDDVCQLAGGELGQVRADFVGISRPEGSSVLDDHQLALHAGERRPAPQRCGRSFVTSIRPAGIARIWIDDGHRAGQIAAEAEQERQPVVRRNPERARLDIAEPTLRHQIIEEWVKPTFLDEGLIGQWQRMSYRPGLRGTEVIRIVDEDTAPPRVAA